MKRGRDLLKTISRIRIFHTLRYSAPQMDLSERYCYNPTLNWNPQVEEYFVKAYGADHFSRISNALTRPSCYACVRVNTLKSTSDAVIEKLLTFIADTGFDNDINATELKKIVDFDDVHMDKKQNGHQNADECPLKRSLESGIISKCRVTGLEYVVFVRGSGPHAIEYDYTCDRLVKEVIVSRKCAEAVLRGAQVRTFLKYSCRICSLNVNC